MATRSIDIILGGRDASGGAFASIGKRLQGLQASAKNAAAGVGHTFANLGGTALKFSGIGAAIGTAIASVASIGKGFSFASELEQDQVAFETMLGSAQQAQSVLSQLKTFAQSTPFELPGVVQSARQLLAYGISADQITPTLRQLGDVAAGVGAPLSDIAYLFGTIKTQGKAMTVDIRQFANRGIPIYEALAKVLHTDAAGVQEMVTAGKVGFPQIQAAFAAMTGEGGKFSGLMDKQSRTLGGLMSNLSDSIGLTLAGIAQKIINAFNLKDAIASFTNWLSGAGDGLVNFIGAVAPKISSFGSWVIGAFKGIIDYLSPWAAYFMDTLHSVLDWIATNVVPPVSAYVGYILSMLELLWTGVKTGIGYIVEVFKIGFSYVGQLLVRFGINVQSIKEIYQRNFITMEFVFRNFKDLMTLGMAEVMLGVVKFGSITEYILVDVIPGFLVWFANNWQDIFTDVFHFTMSVFANLAANIVNIITHIPELVNRTYSFSELWTPLTAGFESQLKELPKIAARQKGPLEEYLQGTVDTLSKGVGEKYSDFLNKRLNETNATGQKFKNAVDNLFSSTATPAPPKPPVPPAPDGSATPGGGAAIGGQKIEVKLPKLEESRFLTGVAAAAREGKTTDPMLKKADEAKKQRDATNKFLKGIYDRLPGASFGANVGVFSGV